MAPNPHTLHHPISHADMREALDNAAANKRVVAGGHWLYSGAHDSEGYPVVRIGSRTDGTRRMVNLFDVACDFYKGASPGTQWDHTCHMEGCWNPQHARAVTQKVNLANRVGYKTKLRGKGIRT
jgi:hypothetical protein